jgi:two-component system response regulator DesR
MQANKEHNDGPSVKVFIAEDSAPIRRRVGTLLAEAQVLTVVGEGATPQGCIDAILTTRPDVVVLDAQLEGGTGLEVMKAVRPVEPGVAFVVFTNNSGPAYRRRYLSEGAADFLDKATEFDQLTRAVLSASHH